MTLRLFSAIVWCGLFLLFLVAPLVLIFDTHGETGFISRLDLFWAILSSPEVFLRPIFATATSEGLWQSAVLIVRSGLSIALCWGLGNYALNRPPRAEGSIERIALRVLVGFTLLGIVSISLPEFRELQGEWGALAVVALAALLAIAIRKFIARSIEPSDSIKRDDRSATFSGQASQHLSEHSWQRRLLGISFLASWGLFVFGLLCCVHPIADLETHRYSWNELFERSNKLPAEGAPPEWQERIDPSNSNAIFHFNAIPRIWIGMDLRFAETGAEDRAAHRIADRYWPFQTGKLVAHAIMWCGFLLIVSVACRGKGELCAVLLVCLLGAFPCFLELSYLARPEAWLIGILALAWAASAIPGSHWREKCSLLFLVAIPLASYGLYVMARSNAIDSSFLDSFGRFFGYSWIYPACWIPTAAVGLLYSKGDRPAVGLFVLSGIVFLVQTMLLQTYDRSWVPFIVLQSGVVATGILQLVSLRRGYTRFAGGLLGLVTTCLILLAWPGIDHRLFIPAEQTLSTLNRASDNEAPMTPGMEPELNFAGELQRLWDEKIIDRQTHVLLVGHWDVLNIPFQTSRLSPAALGTEVAAIEGLRHSGVDMLAIVTPTRSDRESLREEDSYASNEIPEAYGRFDTLIKRWLDAGEIERVDWTTSNRDLILYRVRSSGD